MGVNSITIMLTS